MMYPSYDSPFEIILNGITTQIAKKTDEMTFKAIQQAGITVDKDKLLEILRQDSDRYREAYHRGYASGYQKRDDDIVKCKDCRYWNKSNSEGFCPYHFNAKEEWYCADGDRKEDDETE